MGEDSVLRALILPVDLNERPRVIEWDPADHEEAEAELRREIGSEHVTPHCVSGGVGVWHDSAVGPLKALNARASWLTYVAELPAVILGPSVILQTCCMHGLTRAWIDIALDGITTMPDPWDVAVKVGLDFGRDQ